MALYFQRLIKSGRYSNSITDILLKQISEKSAFLLHFVLASFTCVRKCEKFIKKLLVIVFCLQILLESNSYKVNADMLKNPDSKIYRGEIFGDDSFSKLY